MSGAGLDDGPGVHEPPALTERGRRWRWYRGAVAVWALFTGAGAALVLRGEWAAGAAVFLWGGLYAGQRLAARSAYRQGWRAGFAEASVAGAEVHAGRIPAFVLRAQTRGGDPVPEPWDGVAAPGIEAGVVDRRGRDDNPTP